MKSLPNYIHSKKIFEKISRPIDTFPDVCDEILIQMPATPESSRFQRSSFRLYKSFSKGKKNSNIIDIVIYANQSKPIFFLIFRKLLFPHFLAFLFSFGLIKVEDTLGLYCSEGNDSQYSYNVIRGILTYDFFFILAIYLCLFEEKFKAKITFFGVSMFTLSFIIGFWLKYFKEFRFTGKTTAAESLFFPLIFQVGIFIIIYRRYGKFSYRECKKITFIFMLFFLGVLDMILFRIYLIRLIPQGFLDSIPHKLILQCILFIFYQIYGKLILWFLKKFKNIISQNLFLLIIKIYIANVMSSCVVLPLSRNNGTFIHFFSFLNFFLQIFSLYQQKNFVESILRDIFAFLNYFCRRNRAECKLKKKISQELASMIAGSTNEVMLAITSVVLIILISGKYFVYPIYEITEKATESNYCSNEDLTRFTIFGVENLCFLFGINFFFFLYLIMKMKDKQKSKFLWKTEKFELLGKTLYIIMFYSYLDTSLQFYVYLNLIN